MFTPSPTAAAAAVGSGHRDPEVALHAFGAKQQHTWWMRNI